MRIFHDEVDYRKFVSLLSDVTEGFEVECWNYCLMPNHYHATLRPARPNLSEAIRRLNSVYAQWWNARHGHVGHVFQGRFKDQIVQREEYLLVLCRYIALNPVRAGLVRHPAEWVWSSYAATAGLRIAPAFLEDSPVLLQFGGYGREGMQARYAEYVLGQLPDGAADDRIRSSERILGTSTFKRAVRTQVQGQAEGSDPGLTPV